MTNSTQAEKKLFIVVLLQNKLKENHWDTSNL